MTKITPLKINDPFIGKWSSSDGFSDVIVTISIEANEYNISVIDSSDDELAEVYEIKTKDGALFFKVHWPSTGRFIKYQFTSLPNGNIGVNYTYSGQETWQKIET